MAIEAGYSAVIVSLEKLEKDTDAVKSLRGDKLYGNALTLKAMAYWRLHSFDKANAAAKEAEKEGLDPMSRDKAFVDALPGLIKSDQAYAKLWGPQPAGASLSNDERLKGITELIDSAQQDLDAAQRTLPDRHPMRVYLAVAGLASLKNLADACMAFRVGTNAQANCFDERKIGCRAQMLARTALALGADPAILVLVGQGTVVTPNALTDPKAPMPPNCN